MLHSETLKLLTPVVLGGVFDADNTLVGQVLDQAATRAQALLYETDPTSTYELLSAWERVYAVIPGVDDTIRIRQNRVIMKMRDLGRLDSKHFVQLAQALGYSIVIEELHPFMAGWSAAGMELGDDGSDWCWRAWYTESAGGYFFRSGESYAGEHLSYSYFEVLRNLFEDLKPAETFVEFREY